jgi:chromosome segregation ATPase
MPGITPQMSDDARALQTHFDDELRGIRGIVETLASRVESHHTTQVTQIGNMANTLAEVKGDVKAQNHRVSKGEDAEKAMQEQVSTLRDRVATIEGQRSGGAASTNLIVAILALVAGGGGTAIALAMAGR